MIETQKLRRRTTSWFPEIGQARLHPELTPFMGVELRHKPVDILPERQRSVGE